MSAKLVVVAGPLCGEGFPLEAPGTTIGRDASTQLSIPDRLMSRRHCAIEAAGDNFLLRDLGSSNGTYVNGMPVRERTLEHGDRIRAGDSILLFLAPHGTSPAAASQRPADDLTRPVDRDGMRTSELERGGDPS